MLNINANALNYALLSEHQKFEGHVYTHRLYHTLFCESKWVFKERQMIAFFILSHSLDIFTHTTVHR